MKKNIVCWWSGGVTSAVACKIAIDLYGKDQCKVIMIDTKNEDLDTYRFKTDCEKWYGKEIEVITAIGEGKKYGTIEDIWFDYLTLNNAQGAICSSESKRQVRIDYQRKNKIDYQVFGFDFKSREFKRAFNIKNNYPKSKPIFPLLMMGYSKKDCIKIIQDAGIEIPKSYELGFENNNCLQTGCVQGGIGYWKHYQKTYPERFMAMAKREHQLTDLKGKPVTILKDQSAEAKLKGMERVFLIPHPEYPKYKDLSMMSGKEPENMMECNGFCGIQTQLFNQL